MENLGTLLVDDNAAFRCASDFGVMLDLLPTLDAGAHLGYGVMLDLLRPFPCIGCGGSPKVLHIWDLLRDLGLFSLGGR